MTRQTFEHPQKAAVIERLRACLDMLRARPQFSEFPTPHLYFYEGRAAAGLAHPVSNRIGLHATLLSENTASMLQETVPHELAHVAVYWYWERRVPRGRRPSSHGAEWKHLMRHVFGVEPERTHSYDMSNVKVRRQRRWIYTCACEGEQHVVTTARHNRYSRRPGMFRCVRCRSAIHFHGQA